ncbi:protein of unknown function (plasmid) [Methylocella tundrae]|uniref:Uncharacterized protein n=1 Tax=Methylocella tundrae TaxID=227605 RepID=A0A4U8Z6X4_METTU|nr:protein of unknown function [Methylocella tundrae]
MHVKTQLNAVRCCARWARTLHECMDQPRWPRPADRKKAAGYDAESAQTNRGYCAGIMAYPCDGA